MIGISRHGLVRMAVVTAFVVITVGDAAGQTKAFPAVHPAIDGVLAAFRNHPLVGIGNIEGPGLHDLAQQEDFYAALVRDPRFAREVGNVVVEFGASTAQGLIDRYVSGQDVPYLELRKVWTDTAGFVPGPENMGYVNFFAQIRATNITLPPARRIHVWLGGPPVDWAKVTKPEDIYPPDVNPDAPRDIYYAQMIERRILSQAHKALLIFGGLHFMRDPLLFETGPGQQGWKQGCVVTCAPSMAALIERRHPGAIFSIFTYTGRLANKACATEFEKDKAKLQVPVLLEPIRGTTLDDPAFRKRCAPSEPLTPGRQGWPPNIKDKIAEANEHWIRFRAGLNEDAMLYLGPAASLTESPVMPDAYLDGAYLKEMQRRWRVTGLGNLTPSMLGMTVDKNTVAPRPFAFH